MSKRTRRKFTDEFKDGAVKLVTDQGYSVAEAARNLGVNANLLGRWKKESMLLCMPSLNVSGKKTSFSKWNEKS